MYNYVFLVGRLVKDVEVNKYGEDKNVSTITLAVDRPFKSAKTNSFETDFINVVLWDPYCLPTQEYCHKGDMIAIKGRVAVKNQTLASGEIISTTEIIAERVLFLASTNKNTSD
ncbi:MAG: single-stranded DNA-binding protein [Anaeroplasmataceae bacterium]